MTRQTGKLGEDITVRYLLKQGYRILCRNFHSRYGEIDIICEKNRDIIFVEVKTRKSERFGSAEEAVTLIKQKRLRKTAMVYLQQLDQSFKGLQFDVITVRLDASEVHINHIKNAF